MARAGKRRRWFWFGLLPVLALIGFLILRTLLQPERLSAFLLRQAADATGLELALAKPAGIGLWPDLHLELQGLTARAPGDRAWLLTAEQVDAVLPWSAVGSPTLQLRSLRLHAPVIDVAAFDRWIAARADAGPPAPLRLPQLDAALAVEQGRIIGTDWTIANLDLQLPSLHSGQATSLALSGSLERAGKPERPFALRVQATPQQSSDALRLEAFTLSAHDPELDAPWLQLAGTLTLRYPQQLALELEGRLPQWPSNWTALPLPVAAGQDEVRLTLDYVGAPDAQGELNLRVARGDESLSGALQLGDLAGWAGDPSASPLPPVQGTIDAARLQFDGVELRGVRLRIDDAASKAPDAKP